LIYGVARAPSPGVYILGDYVVGEGDDVSGAFIFESGGLLSEIEFYSLGGDALQVLPDIEELRPSKIVSELPAKSGHPHRLTEICGKYIACTLSLTVSTKSPLNCADSLRCQVSGFDSALARSRGWQGWYHLAA
jgi:hypothetical protein